MGYLHIDNLYAPRAQKILEFQWLYALEKIHGTSTSLTFDPATNTIQYHSGGCSHVSFVLLFDEVKLLELFKAANFPIDRTVTIFGEGYGGSQQKMSKTYGDKLKFIAFDVKVGNTWLDVPNAESVVTKLGLEFVYYKKVSVLNVEVREGIKYFIELDAERDAPSVQAQRNGITEPRKREGVVLRPPFEATLANGDRLIVKHKGDEFRETASPKNILADPVKLEVLSEATAVATEWVTNERLQHVLDKIPGYDMKSIPTVIQSMTLDVLREGREEIVDSPAVRKAISVKTVELFRAFITKIH